MTRTPAEQTREIKALLVRAFGTRATRIFAVRTIKASRAGASVDLRSTIRNLSGAPLLAQTAADVVGLLGRHGFVVDATAGVVDATRPERDTPEQEAADAAKRDALIAALAPV